ncbi:MAG: dipeptidase [Roseovarius sp.]|nr:dipeptidase [Roseovarius sp.]
MNIDDVLVQIDSQMQESLGNLMSFMRIPSISTDPSYRKNCREAADWLASYLKSANIPAEVYTTSGHPMVLGHTDGPGPHLLFYGHYDVQPVDPLEQWHTPPFEPCLQETSQGQVIRGRGSSDDKGQLMTFVEACRACIQIHGSLPCKTTFFFEGEEEAGSPSLVPFMREHKDKLAAEIALVCDTSMISPGVPSIASRLRGIMKDEFTLLGPSVDLHSGSYGGPALNPLHEISKIVASLHNDNGGVAVEGFHEGVGNVDESILSQWSNCGFDEKAYLHSAGMTRPHGEAGYTTLEQQWARPTLEVNGLWGGYQGVGSKTVIPAEAHCKFTCRLVGDMDPDHVRKCIRKHVNDRLSDDVKITWDNEPEGSPASVMDVNRPEFALARKALSEEWGREAVFTGMGGSIPVTRFFADILNMESMLVGFAQDDDAIHSPNEKYNVNNFHKGIRSWARIVFAIAGSK